MKTRGNPADAKVPERTYVFKEGKMFAPNYLNRAAVRQSRGSSFRRGSLPRGPL